MPKCIQIPLYIVDIDLPIYPQSNVHGAYFIVFMFVQLFFMFM